MASAVADRVGNIRLGYEDGREIKAKDVLVPIGSREMVSRKSSSAGTERPDFVVPIEQPYNKFTHDTDYDALKDPALRKFFKKSTWHECRCGLSGRCGSINVHGILRT